MAAKLTLDVGCGPLRTTGDINIDIRKIKRKGFIRADAHYLPFKSNVFKTVLCSHVLEHCTNPAQVIQECKRVTNGHLIFKVPNNPIWDLNNETHLFSWNKYTFRNLLERQGLNMTITPGYRCTLLDSALLRRKKFLMRWLNLFLFVIMRGLMKESNELIATS